MAVKILFLVFATIVGVCRLARAQPPPSSSSSKVCPYFDNSIQCVMQGERECENNGEVRNKTAVKTKSNDPCIGNHLPNLFREMVGTDFCNRGIDVTPCWSSSWRSKTIPLFSATGSRVKEMLGAVASRAAEQNVWRRSRERIWPNQAVVRILKTTNTKFATILCVTWTPTVPVSGNVEKGRRWI